MSVLPTEILNMIFSRLSNKDLSMVGMVCRRLKEVGEDPTLWTWGKVEVSREDHEMLGMRRLAHVQEVRVLEGDWESVELEILFQTVVRLPKLCTLNMPNISLTCVPPVLLATAITMVEEVHLSDCHLTRTQVDTLGGRMGGPTKLCILYIDIAANWAIVDQVVVKRTRKVDRSRNICFVKQAGRDAWTNLSWTRRRNLNPRVQEQMNYHVRIVN